MEGFSIYKAYKEAGHTVLKEGHRRIIKNMLNDGKSGNLAQRLSNSNLLRLNAPVKKMSTQQILNTLVKNLPAIDFYVKASLDHLVLAADPTTQIAKEILIRYNRSECLVCVSFDDAFRKLEAISSKHGMYVDGVIINIIRDFVLSDEYSYIYPIVASQHAEKVLATNSPVTFSFEQELILKLFTAYGDYKELEEELLKSFIDMVEENKYDYVCLVDIFYLIEKVQKLTPYLPIVDKMCDILSDYMYELAVEKAEVTE